MDMKYVYVKSKLTKLRKDNLVESMGEITIITININKNDE